MNVLFLLSSNIHTTTENKEEISISTKYNTDIIVGFVMISIALIVIFGAIATSCSKRDDDNNAIVVLMSEVDHTSTAESSAVMTTSTTETTTGWTTTSESTTETKCSTTTETSYSTTTIKESLIETPTEKVSVSKTTAPPPPTTTITSLTTNPEETKVSTVTTTVQTESVQKVYYSEQDILDIARVLYSECRGVPSVTEQACVAWTILNRVDMDNSSVYSVVRKKGAFAFNSSAPVWDNLYSLAKDVLDRWSREKNGETNVGRVLPKEYIYFEGRNGHNYFRDNYRSPYNVWNYSLWSPYES